MLLLLTPPSGIAHLNTDPGVECFRMVDHQVEPIPNSLTRSPHADVISIEPVPAWLTKLTIGDKLNMKIRVRVALCRPYSIFVAPVHPSSDNAMQFTSPSPVYDPGETEHAHSAFIGFTAENAYGQGSASIEGIEVRIVEYGSNRILHEASYPLSAQWHPTTTMLNPTERCTKQHLWPAERHLPRECYNATAFAPQPGITPMEKIDLNTDGICEMIAQVESCRKLNHNTCFKIYAETDGYYREIWQYYNRLYTFPDENGYAVLGSTETGAVQVHRVGRYDPLQRRYITERILTPCREQETD